VDYTRAMAAITHFVPHVVGSPLERVRDLVLRGRVPTDGRRVIHAPEIAICRYSEPTAFRKAATFGVTMAVVLQGQKKLRIGKHDEILVDPERILVITRESAHISISIAAAERRPFVGMSISFPPERVARALLELADAGAPTAAETVPAFVMPPDDGIADALERLVRTLENPIERKVIAPLIVNEILYRLLYSDSAAAIRGAVAGAPDALRILTSMRFIEEHLADKLKVSQLAKLAGMSASHYAHRFSSIVRISPMRFLREARLERARTLLMESGTRANEAAALVGFESAAHFTREFKRRFGVTPSHYLRARSA
jgi:AraC-like DNA-binding protein